MTRGPLPAGSPTWSPRGDAVAFAGGARGRRGIAVVGADGNGRRALTALRGDSHSPAWSSDDRIAFVHRAAGRGADDDLYVMTADGKRSRRLTGGPTDDRSPAWSPNARRIAFTRRAGGRRDVYVMDARGRRARRLTTSGDASSPAWSPDGRRIVFSAGTAPRRALYVVPSSGGKPRRITPYAADARFPAWQPTGGDPVVAAAGDVACDPASPFFNAGLGLARRCRQRQTSDLLLRTELWAVLALGDLQYEDGTLSKFEQSFEPSWGRLKGLLRPVPGNHEYRTPGAAGYFDYFNGAGRQDGPAGRRGDGWYSFDVGEWHVVALNSQCSEPSGNPSRASCAVGSPQERWLRADLAAHRNRCTLAYWHHPYVGSGRAIVNDAVRPLWQALYDAGADVVLSGHDHAYERFAPQDAAQAPDPARGLRLFVVGTGGKSLQQPVAAMPNSQVRDARSAGVLQLTLHRTGYEWGFMPDTAGGFTDAGTAECH